MRHAWGVSGAVCRRGKQEEWEAAYEKKGKGEGNRRGEADGESMAVYGGCAFKFPFACCVRRTGEAPDKCRNGL